MGQFSWCCAICNQEVMHGRQPGYQWTTDVVILWPNGDRRTGRYEDGYGHIAGMDLVDMTAIRPDEHGRYGHDSYNVGGWRIVHQRCLAAKNGASVEELFASFGPELHASDQGWWPGERLAVKRYGGPDLDELKEENTYFCRLCLRTWKAKWSGGVCIFGCVRPLFYGVPERYRKEHPDWYPDGDSGQEIVEPFRYLSGSHGLADGLGICHNHQVERVDWKRYHALPNDVKRDMADEDRPTVVEPCFRFGELQQIRVEKPLDWWEEDGLFEIRCGSCRSTNVEVVTLTPSELPKGA